MHVGVAVGGGVGRGGVAAGKQEYERYADGFHGFEDVPLAGAEAVACKREPPEAVVGEHVDAGEVKDEVGTGVLQHGRQVLRERREVRVVAGAVRERYVARGGRLVEGIVFSPCIENV